MKKTLLLTIIITLIILTTGCNSKEASIPEPYTKMIENMKSNDLAMTEKYADLVIKDFSDSDYVYNAYLVKNMIISSKIHLNNCKMNCLSQGISNMGALNSKEDIDNVEKYLDDVAKNLEDLSNDYNTTTEYLLENYSKSDIIKIEFPKAPSGMTQLGDNDILELTFFASVGYPVPTEVEMNGNDSNNVLKIFYYINNGFLQDKNFSFIDYFYYISRVTSNEDLVKKLLNKVIQLTEDDEYNEFRIQAQDELSAN